MYIWGTFFFAGDFRGGVAPPREEAQTQELMQRMVRNLVLNLFFFYKLPRADPHLHEMLVRPAWSRCTKNDSPHLIT